MQHQKYNTHIQLKKASEAINGTVQPEIMIQHTLLSNLISNVTCK